MNLKTSFAFTRFSQNSSMFLSLSIFIQYCLLLHPHPLSMPQIYSTWECYLNSLLSPRIIPDKSNMGCYPLLLSPTFGKKCLFSVLLHCFTKFSISCTPLAPFFTIPFGTWLSFSFSGPLGHWTSHSILYFTHLIHNHGSQYFHAIKLPSKKRYIIVSLLNHLSSPWHHSANV